MAKIPKGTPEWFARSTALGEIVMAEHKYLLDTGWACFTEKSNVVRLRSAWPEGRALVRWVHATLAKEPVQEEEALRRQRAADREEL